MQNIISRILKLNDFCKIFKILKFKPLEQNFIIFVTKLEKIKIH